MSRFLIFCVALGIYAGQAKTASAGPLGELLTFDGGVDVLVDDSVSVARDLNGNFILDEGDIIQGVFRINVVNNLDAGGSLIGSNPVAGSIFGVTSLQVDEILTDYNSGTDNKTTYSFRQIENIPVDAPNAVDEYGLSAMLQAAGFDVSGLDSTALDNSSFALIDRSDPVTLGTAGLDATTLVPFSGESVRTLGLNGADWDVQVIGGLDGVDDFYQVEFDYTTDAFDPVVAPGTNDPLILAQIPALDPGRIADFALALSIFDSNLSGAVFLDLSRNDFDGNPGVGQLINSSGSLFKPDPLLGTPPPGFGLTDDGVFGINAVPEPTSVTLGLIGVVGVACLVRRRKVSADQSIES